MFSCLYIFNVFIQCPFENYIFMHEVLKISGDYVTVINEVTDNFENNKYKSIVLILYGFTLFFKVFRDS